MSTPQSPQSPGPGEGQESYPTRQTGSVWQEAREWLGGEEEDESEYHEMDTGFSSDDNEGNEDLAQGLGST